MQLGVINYISYVTSHYMTLVIDKLSSRTLFELIVTGSTWTYWRKGENYASWESNPRSLCNEGVVNFRFFPFDSHTYVAVQSSSVWLFLELWDCFCFLQNMFCNCSDNITFAGESYYLHISFLLTMYLTLPCALLEDTDNQHRVWVRLRPACQRPACTRVSPPLTWADKHTCM